MSRIRVLPDQLVNQIAAGEVVERPASVVKELLENALDAGASAVTIVMEAGGRRLVRVADDGEGLDRDDALLALERHATSKLGGLADLSRIATLGFRGEALPAIASVCRLTLATSRGDGAGTRIEVEGGAVRSVQPHGHPRGTTVEVRDLFFNTPARAKFLRSPATELGHIVDLVSAYAVAAPTLRLALHHDGRALLEAPPAAEPLDRLRRVLGDEWDDAVPIHGERGGFKLSGFLAPAHAAAAIRRMQHLYVNGRWVKDRLVAHAVAAAAERFVPRGRHARVVLFIACPTEAVDVNVHPAKAEVRFREGRTLHDLAHEAVSAAFERARPLVALSPPRAEAWAETEAGAGTEAGRQAAAAPGEALREPSRPFGAARGSRWSAELWRPPAGMEPLPAMEGASALAHYRQSYIVAADEEGLMLVDQHAAHERILYDRLVRAAAGEDPAATQALLFPVTAPVPRRLAEDLEALAERLAPLGLRAEPMGPDALILREVSTLLGEADPARLLADLLCQLDAQDAEEDAGPESSGRLRHRLLATTACHAAVKVRMPLTPEKMNYLISELFRTSTPLKCPHGRPAVLRLSHKEIERVFLRS
ncbi:MAG TPA: DNA mismatch repair endonuclease MutL [Candidatus Polarisedimenticolia bacterium]|nr:DNA mismatch repair endonuclease MutL [Candidatus Polarisedimenticolia bacterium]